jgi:site-specific DNA recombinase
LKRIYRSVEDGIAEQDDILRNRIGELKAKREQSEAALERARERAGVVTPKIDTAKVDAFARL